MKTIVVEAGAPIDASGTVCFRWTCPKCGRAGEWMSSLNKAEREAAAHNREQHAEGASA